MWTQWSLISISSGALWCAQKQAAKVPFCPTNCLPKVGCGCKSLGHLYQKLHTFDNSRYLVQNLQIGMKYYLLFSLYPCAVFIGKHKDFSNSNYGRSTWVKILPICALNRNFCFINISLCFNNVHALNNLHSLARRLLVYLPIIISENFSPISHWYCPSFIPIINHLAVWFILFLFGDINNINNNIIR